MSRDATEGTDLQVVPLTEGVSDAAIERSNEESRSIIRIRSGELDRIATEAEEALIRSGLPIFQRGSDLVRPVTREVSAAQGRTTVSAALGALGIPALRDLYCQTARWEKVDRRIKKWVPANPPSEVAAIHLSRSGQWLLPSISGVITTPSLRPDGSILFAPGYDRTTLLYHVSDPSLTLASMPVRPTRQDAHRALEDLNLLIQGFPFVGQADRAVALAALITPVVRGAMAVAPLFAIRASTPGTGKSYLVDLASVVSTGRLCPVISAGSTGEETEKRLGGLLLEGFPVLSIDNINGELGGDLLCQAVERPLVRVRRLGVSDITEIESRATIFATGNGLRVRGDMVRRALLCTLDANVERPELREFRTDPVEMVLSNRGKYVAAALTIVRAFRSSGAPTLKALASFEAWSDTVRSAIVWLQCGDPCSTMDIAREEDPELDELRELIVLWTEHLGPDAHSVGEIADQATRRHQAEHGYGQGELILPKLRDVLLRIAGDRGNINTGRLGRWLGSKAGRIVDGRRIVKGGTKHGGGVAWAVR